MNPSEKYHNSHLLIDQNTGVILKSEVNFQTNIELNRWALKQANISGMIQNDRRSEAGYNLYCIIQYKL